MCEWRKEASVERARRLLLIALMGLILSATNVSGLRAVQDGGPESTGELDAARARLDSLRLLLGDARDRAAAESQALLAARRTRSNVPLDTVRAGPFRLAVLEGEGEEARRYFERAWSYYAPMFEGEPPEALGDYLFGFRHGISKARPPADPNMFGVYEPAWRRSSEVEGATRRVVGLALAQALPAWSELGGTGAVAAPWGLEGVYRQLVLESSIATARCREGHLESCWFAMGGTGDADPVTEIALWYSPDEQRAMVAELAEADRARSVLGSQIANAQRCLVGADLACSEVLAAHPRRSWLVPLAPSAVASLMTVAVEMGGPGALTRFVTAAEAGEGLRGRVAAAAQAPSDAVMAEWQRRVVSARPDRYRDAREIRIASLFWILVFAVFSTRSTRWRLG